MKISCILPSYNEESTIKKVIETIKKVKTIDEIIVVDDGSTDNTYVNAKQLGVEVIRHEKNKGKGAAIKTGIHASKGDILLFLDSDLCNLSPKKITSIIQPLRNDEADFVKTSFTRKRGRVTELVVKPLFNVIFPFITFNQPLSGQFAVKKEHIKGLKIDDKWGVDIQILLQLVKKGVRIKEVDIGHLSHKKQPLESLAVMSEQVIKSILSELGIIANKHKLILFDFDQTLIQESSIEIVAKELGFEKDLKVLRKKYSKGLIKDSDITLELAKKFRGKRLSDVERACKKIRLTHNVSKVIDRLKKRQYRLGIISLAFSPVVYHFAEKLGIPKDNIVCPILLTDKYGRYTGEVIAQTKHNSDCCDKILCKHDAAKLMMEKFAVSQEESISVADGKSDKCMFKACGLAILYNSEILLGDVKITHMSEVLIYAE